MSCGRRWNQLQPAGLPVTATANAGPAQTVYPSQTITLDGSASSADGFPPLTYVWRQISGTAVTLSSTTVVQPTFTSPADITDLTLVFGLIVTNAEPVASTESTVTITVKAGPRAYRLEAGQWINQKLYRFSGGQWIWP